MKSIIQEVSIQSSKELVWYAWIIEDRVTKWFAPAAHVEGKLGGAFELFFVPDNPDIMGTKGCKFIQFEPMDRLAFTWKGPDDFAEIMNQEGSLTTVHVTFSENGASTQVTVEHAGWGDGPEWEKAKEWHVMAWKQVLGSLKSSIESGEGDLCCVPEKNVG